MLVWWKDHDIGGSLMRSRHHLGSIPSYPLIRDGATEPSRQRCFDGIGASSRRFLERDDMSKKYRTHSGRNGIDVPFVPQFNHGEYITFGRSDSGSALVQDKYGRTVHA
jgi:hypothetical protein